MSINRNYSKISKTRMPPRRPAIHWRIKQYDDGSALVACCNQPIGPKKESSIHTKDVSCYRCLHQIFLKLTEIEQEQLDEQAKDAV